MRRTIWSALIALMIVPALSVGGALAQEDPGLLVYLDFNELVDGHYVDQSPAHLTGTVFGAEQSEGVNGYGVRIPGGNQSVNVDLPAGARALAAVSVEAWISPEEPRYANLVTAAGGDRDANLFSFMLRWRLNWQFWWQLRTADGEDRLLIPPGPSIPSITAPTRQWAHVVGTYDGAISILYVNGQEIARRAWPNGPKPVLPITGPVQVGGRGEAFRGALDEVRVYSRALSAQEVAAHYQAARELQPAAPPAREAKLPGTLDGRPFTGHWQVVRIPNGQLYLSNNGLVAPAWTPPLSWADWSFGGLDLAGMGGAQQNYFREVTGGLESRADGSALLEFTGKTYNNWSLQGKMEVNPAGEIHLRYEITALAPNAPAPVLSWSTHLWPSALRFVGSDAEGLVTGNLMDLDGGLKLQDLVEVNLVRGGGRLAVLMAEGTVWRIEGTRDPRRWINGYTYIVTDFRPAGWRSWAQDPTAVIELAIKLEPDNTQPRLVRADAREVTKPLPFDFSGLYRPDPTKVWLQPDGADAPVWVPGEEVQFNLGAPAALQEQAETFPWVLANAETGAKVAEGKARVGGAPVWGRLSFPAPVPGAYVLKLQAVDATQKVLGEATSEVIIAGPVAQREMRTGEALPLKKIDEVDFTATDPGHDFFSYTGGSQVVREGNLTYRRTMNYQEAFVKGGSSGAGLCDWFGVRFRTEPGKIYVLETEYPDLDGMSVSMYLVEPKEDPADGKATPVTRTATGIFTGGALPHDGKLTTMQTVHFASAPWVAVTYQDAHMGRGGTDLPPASIKRATLYEVVNGDLPKLNAPETPDRLIGVHCESGGLALPSFSPVKMRGELGNWLDPPAAGEFYRRAAAATENLIRYMRYRGDNCLYYGIYRYRGACFPSRLFPPSSTDIDHDLPALMARMFEANGLKLVFVIMPCAPLPVQRLHEFSRWDVAQGAPATVPVDLNGDLRTFSPYNPTANPFNDQVREAYASLASELGQRYGKYPSVAAIGFMTGMWWEPALPLWLSGYTKDNVLSGFLLSTYDDETIRRFEAWAHLDVPGEGTDPGRFKLRHDWILQNALQQFVEYRCYENAQTQLAFARALRAQAPNTDYMFLDYYGGFFNAELPFTPLQSCRLAASDPQFLRDQPGFVHMPYLPQYNGATLWEHGQMKREAMPQVLQFLTDEELAAAWDTSGRSARYIHRQFYEQGLDLPADRKWIWASSVSRLSTCSYPQESGRGYLADFVLSMARGTPNYLSYMWCDSTIPLGMEPQHQEFARVFRSLPAGHYREGARQDGVFCRFLEKPEVFYVVNTNGQPVRVTLKTGVTGAFTEVATGKQLEVDAEGETFDLKPFEMRVYLGR